MANTFQFIGKISRKKENAFVEKTFDSGWVINELNLIMTCGDNVQFLRASGGMWDEKHSDKNSVMTYKYNENDKDEPVTVAWSDRFDKNIVNSIANYRTYSVDTEIKETREEIKNSGDEVAIEKSNKKHKIFITAIDFVQWLNRVTSDEKTKDWIWKVTGDVEYSYSKGRYYRNFVPRRVYHVDSSTEPRCVGTIKTFYSEGCIDEGENDTVFDIYCGIGTISLFLAQKAKKVYGIEIVEDAIKDAKRNAKINNMDNVEFYVGKAEEVVPKMYKEGKRANVVVVDPPRKGCDEKVLDTIISMQPDRVVYVSCNPSTLARDLAYLNERGYKCHEIQPVDMFPHSVHVENVAWLSKADN